MGPSTSFSVCLRVSELDGRLQLSPFVLLESRRTENESENLFLAGTGRRWKIAGSIKLKVAPEYLFGCWDKTP